MTQQSDGSCNVTSDSQLLYILFLFISANAFDKFIVSKEYCFAATMTRCASYPIADITLI